MPHTQIDLDRWELNRFQHQEPVSPHHREELLVQFLLDQDRWEETQVYKYYLEELEMVLLARLRKFQ
jgi:hypothetical protein